MEGHFFGVKHDVGQDLGKHSCFVCCSCDGIGIDNVCTVQPQYMAIPAGMLDGNGDFAGAMAREMEEETGIRNFAATCRRVTLRLTTHL